MEVDEPLNSGEEAQRCNVRHHEFLVRDQGRRERDQKDYQWRIGKLGSEIALLEAEVASLTREQPFRDAWLQRKIKKQSRYIKHLEEKNAILRRELFASQGIIHNMQRDKETKK
jgi:predicted RNase H-like nuclease (RuvC/YqgF family)